MNASYSGEKNTESPDHKSGARSALWRVVREVRDKLLAVNHFLRSLFLRHNPSY